MQLCSKPCGAHGTDPEEGVSFYNERLEVLVVGLCVVSLQELCRRQRYAVDICLHMIVFGQTRDMDNRRPRRILSRSAHAAGLPPPPSLTLRSFA